MTEPSEAALAKVRELCHADPFEPTSYTFARSIQQVSDTAKEATSASLENTSRRREQLLAPFMLPDPVDPLVEALRSVVVVSFEQMATDVREFLAKRGLKIVKDKP